MPQPDFPSSKAVEDLLQPYRKLVTRLRRSDALTRGDVDLALQQVTELAAEVLRVGRSSVWSLANDGSRIDCLDLFIAPEGVHRKIGAVEKRDAAAYFAALETERCIVADDARLDPRTSSLAPYLVANGIGAMLDAPVFVHGEMVGVVCHEHIGGRRSWHLWEELVAATMADFVALVMEAEERVRAQAEAALYRAHLEEERMLRSVFEAAPVPLALASIDGFLQLLNPRAREVMGIETFVPGGLHVDHFYASSDERDELRRKLRRTGFVDNREIRMKNAAGEERWFLISLREIVYRQAQHTIMGFSDISSQKEVESKLRDAATRDPLMGIYNRRHFFDVAAKELVRSTRYGRPLSLAMFDADHFKQKNDTHGHIVGDELLVAFGKLGAGELRQSDLIARYGGEELVALFPETHLDAAFAVADRIRQRIGTKPLPTTVGPVGMTCSAGIVAFDGRESLEKLIDRADRALYAAKAAGRNRVERG